MDVENNTREHHVSDDEILVSDFPESLESTRKQDNKLSDEEVWLNYCQVTDTDILESNWTSFKDVLVEFVGNEPESVGSSATWSDGFAGGSKLKTVHSTEEAAAANDSGTREGLIVETITNDGPIRRTTPILANYNDDERKGAAIDLGLQLSSSTDEADSSTVDIFRLWELNIPVPAEEGDLVEQLNQAISSTVDIFRLWELNIPVPAEEGDLVEQLNQAISETDTSFQSMPPASDDSTDMMELD